MRRYARDCVCMCVFNNFLSASHCFFTYSAHIRSFHTCFHIPRTQTLTHNRHNPHTEFLSHQNTHTHTKRSRALCMCLRSRAITRDHSAYHCGETYSRARAIAIWKERQYSMWVRICHWTDDVNGHWTRAFVARARAIIAANQSSRAWLRSFVRSSGRSTIALL